MTKLSGTAIAVIAVVLLVLVYSASMKMLEVSNKKETYGGANFGWLESDYSGGPRADPHAVPKTCSPQATCNAKCNVAPEGMTRSQCMTHCELYGPGISGKRCTSVGCA